MNKQVTEDLNERFFEDLENAIKEGYYENTPSFFTSAGNIVIKASTRKVLEVIGKYSAIPNEPKENEVTNS